MNFIIFRVLIFRIYGKSHRIHFMAMLFSLALGPTFARRKFSNRSLKKLVCPLVPLAFNFSMLFHRYSFRFIESILSWRILCAAGGCPCEVCKTLGRIHNMAMEIGKE